MKEKMAKRIRYFFHELLGVCVICAVAYLFWSYSTLLSEVIPSPLNYILPIGYVTAMLITVLIAVVNACNTGKKDLKEEGREEEAGAGKRDTGGLA